MSSLSKKERMMWFVEDEFDVLFESEDFQQVLAKLAFFEKNGWTRLIITKS